MGKCNHRWTWVESLATDHRGNPDDHWGCANCGVRKPLKSRKQTTKEDIKRLQKELEDL